MKEKTKKEGNKKSDVESKKSISKKESNKPEEIVKTKINK